ncbi:MAG: ABC transporter permease subunit [Candidatus Dormiibacterota bacterium]
MRLPPLLVFAKLAIWEVSRRRLLLALAVLTVILIGLTGWGFSHLRDAGFNNGRALSEVEVRLLASQMLIFVAFLFSGVLALSAVFVAAPSISGDLESNIALALLARPVRRWDYLLGRWLGLAVLVVVYAVATGLLAVLAVWLATGYTPPHMFQLVAAVAGEGLVLLTLAILFSTRVPGMTGGIVALVLWFMAWIGGIVGGVGQALNNTALSDAGLAMRLILPTDALWRAAVYAMEPAAVIATNRALGPVASANPFSASDPIAPAMLVWSVLWVVVVLALALLSFRRREI